ncbi:MAG: triosephosphate isomerase [Candidatus Azotimanducaceae bacterium]|jgi:triosephosphate isomerase
MRTSLVVGNWKMNGSEALLGSIVPSLLQAGSKTEIVICPSYIHLAQAAGHLKQAEKNVGGSSVFLGSQDLDWHERGAYTGEVSAEMLLEVSCKYSIVGHSERRTIFGETDEIVALKFAACLDAGLAPILCLGESLAQRKAGETEEVVGAQLRFVLDKFAPERLGNIVLAYEPIWAIGTGETASPEQAESVHALIRGILAEKSETLASKTRILYGGSVNENNAADLFKMGNIDGALVGGASLKVDAFMDICDFAGQ